MDPKQLGELAPRTEHVGFGRLLRGADRAAAERVFARLGVEQLCGLVPLLDEVERAALAAIAFSPERARGAAILPVVTLEALLCVATLDDAERVLQGLADGARRALVAKQPPARRAALEKRLFPEQRGPRTGAHGRVGTVFRLRRLFRG